jgi:hypothetical protein
MTQMATPSACKRTTLEQFVHFPPFDTQTVNGRVAVQLPLLILLIERQSDFQIFHVAAGKEHRGIVYLAVEFRNRKVPKAPDW